MKKLLPFVLCCAWALPLAASGKATRPPVLVKTVLPPQPVASPGVVIEPTRVEMVVDEYGVPFSLNAARGLSDEMVSALSKWRFKPGIKNNRRTAYAISFLIPVPWTLTPARERELAQTWVASGLLIEVFDLARSWDTQKITKLQKRLRIKPQRADVIHGLPLLHALLSGSPQKIRQAREDHLLWMVRNTPRAEFLATPAALVGTSGEPFGDPQLRHQITQEWLKQVSAEPNSFDILDHAVNFLEFADPEKAAALIARVKGWPKAARWLGHEYGLQGVGVTGLNPVSGLPNTRDHSLPITPFAVETRLALLKGKNTKFVLAGLAAVIGIKQVLENSGGVPAGLDAFCGKLLIHARQLYPKTSLSCDMTTPLFYDSAGVAGATPARRIRQAAPRYPTEALNSRIQGTVKLLVLIDRRGQVKDLEFLSGPLVFYRTSVDAVSRWKYRPATLNGKPMEARTTITVNFQMVE